MKMKICTSSLAVILLLFLAVSALTADGNLLLGDSGNMSKLNLSAFSTLIDLSYQAGEGENSQYFRSYAFAEQGKTALQWKEIKPGELTIDLRWDISKIVRKPGKLILSSAAVSGNTAKNVADCENAGAASKIGYVIFTITGIRPDPAAIDKNMLTYAGDDVFINIGAGNEWSKDGYHWQPADKNGPGGTDTADKWCKIELSTEKQTVFVRGKAETGDPGRIILPSLKSVKVAVPAIAKAPKVNIYLAKGFLSAKVGMEISNDGKTWAKMTANTLPLGAVTPLPASVGGGTVPIDLNDKKDVYIRTPAGGGKPPSDIFETRIKLRDAGSVSAEHFSPAPGMSILVDNSVAIEAYISGKWSKVKKISASDIPANGLRVRRAGTKDRMVGPESLLKLVLDDGVKTISVT